MHETPLTIVYVALGSNLGDRERHIAKACEDISTMQACSNLVCSSVYETDPMGPQNQPDYLNAVCRFSYSDAPLYLMEELQGIERQHGRIQSNERWTARP
ncbi:MAG: 2-amino-4-hydroxy-6-hydroxymethyldihydropteridine diphosphokinase, partial [Flavobacteriaceae bacterium]